MFATLANSCVGDVTWQSVRYNCLFPAVVSRRREMRNRFIHHSKVATSEPHADVDGKNKHC